MHPKIYKKKKKRHFKNFTHIFGEYTRMQWVNSQIYYLRTIYFYKKYNMKFIDGLERLKTNLYMQQKCTKWILAYLLFFEVVRKLKGLKYLLGHFITLVLLTCVRHYPPLSLSLYSSLPCLCSLRDFVRLLLLHYLSETNHLL